MEIMKITIISSTSVKPLENEFNELAGEYCWKDLNKFPGVLSPVAIIPA